MGADKPWRFEASARGPRAFLVLGLWWGLVLLGLWAIELNIWIALALLTFSLPAIWELVRGATAYLEIDKTHVRWGSGRRSGEVARNEIGKVRLDTRLDFSLRMSIVLHNGRKIRLPYECLPRAARLKAALDQAGLAHEHHHFSLLS
ncbi:hypothetical protein [Primorskyibacter sp. S187A]|uniref:hypothetical protein n=1 Tax=Primorskyibacter sp. S187A TaxID=3415130 RepID=UPI003C7CFBCB